MGKRGESFLSMVNYIYSFLYVLIASLSYIFLDDTVKGWPPAMVLIFTVFLAALYFNAINIKNIKAVYSQAAQDKWNLLWVNLTVMVMWGCAFYSVYYIGPFDYLFIFYATAAIFGFFFQIRETKHLLVPRLISLLAILAIIFVYIVFLEVCNREGAIWGDFLALLSGTMSYAYSKSSFVFSKRTSLGATQILSVRFYFLLLFSLILLGVSPKVIVNLNLDAVWHIVLLAALLFVLPLYFFQKAVIKVGPEAQSIFIAFTPAVTYLFEILIYREFDIYIFVLSLVLAAFLIMPSILKLKYKNLSD